jgi:hypothetical protein
MEDHWRARDGIVKAVVFASWALAGRKKGSTPVQASTGAPIDVGWPQ